MKFFILYSIKNAIIICYLACKICYPRRMIVLDRLYLIIGITDMFGIPI